MAEAASAEARPSSSTRKSTSLSKKMTRPRLKLFSASVIDWQFPGVERRLHFAGFFWRSEDSQMGLSRTTFSFMHISNFIMKFLITITLAEFTAKRVQFHFLSLVGIFEKE